jgi:hypothetical protein
VELTKLAERQHQGTRVGSAFVDFHHPLEQRFGVGVANLLDVQGTEIRGDCSNPRPVAVVVAIDDRQCSFVAGFGFPELASRRRDPAQPFQTLGSSGSSAGSSFWRMSKARSAIA